MARLVRLMDVLRSRAGCPWDRRQTHHTLRAHLIEETYEALDAIDRRDFAALPGELGDVLFQCVFHAQIAAERGRFDFADAVNAITAKLIRRHPHVFTAAGRPLAAGDARRRRIRTPEAVKEQWERIKARESSLAGRRTGILTGVPRAMPALLRAHEIGRRVAAVGFDWPRPEDVVAKMDEEVLELRQALLESPDRAAEELGDFLFSAASLARQLGIEPESALQAANEKFTKRFDALEAGLERQGRSIHDADLAEMERMWQQVKKAGRPAGRGAGTTRARGRSGR